MNHRTTKGTKITKKKIVVSCVLMCPGCPLWLSWGGSPDMGMTMVVPCAKR